MSSGAGQEEDNVSTSMGQTVIGMLKAIDAKIKAQNDELIAALEAKKIGVMMKRNEQQQHR